MHTKSMSKIKELLKITQELKDEIRKTFDITNEDIEENIQLLRKWMEQTPHLPTETSDSRLEYFMLHHKMSLEKAKVALEGYYTARSVLPEFFDKLTTETLFYQRAKSYTCVVCMPDLTKDYSRITIHKLTNVDSEIFEPLDSLILLLMISEIRFSEDYNCKEIVIIDMAGYSIKHLVKFTPKILRKMRYVLMKSLNYYIKEIHIIHAPQFVDRVLPILRALVPGRIYKKVYVHSTLEHFHQFVSPDYLPSDYGGTQKCLIELFNRWVEEIEFCGPFFSKHVEQKSDETKRIGRNHEFEIFGTGSEGSFKKINLQQLL